MIKLRSFIDAIHDAILVANDTLTDSSESALSKFFTKVEKHSETGELVSEEYKAKSISLKYPHITEDGVEEIEVEVPLLTISPITFPTIDKVSIKSKFSMSIVNSELMVEFVKEKSSESTGGNSQYGEIDIVISPQDPPEGMKVVIEGYEKILKSNIQ